MPMNPLRAALRLALPSLLLCACGSGGGGDALAPVTGSGSTPVQLLLGVGPADGLLAFESRVTGLRFERVDGTETADLLAGDQSLEWLGLGDRFALISSVPIAQGTFAAVIVDFDAAGLEAKACDGAPVGVTGGGTWRVDLDPPRALGGPSGGRLALELDLVDSIDGDASLGLVDFDPIGAVLDADGDDDLTVDDLYGIVQSVDQAGKAFVIEAYLGADALVPIGQVKVSLTADALLLGLDDQPAPSAASFLNKLIPGQSVVEVHGMVGPGSSVIADLVELEDQIGPDGLVRIEGIVLAVGDDSTFELLIAEIEQGVLLAESVLSDLGDPASIGVEWNDDTLFLFDDSNQLGAHGDLSVGQRIDVRFAEFATEPFLALEIELDADGGSFEGIVVDVSELPDRFTIRLMPDDPALYSGAVDSAATKIDVELDGSEGFELQLPHKPALVAGDLLEDLRVKVKGELTGPAGDPTIHAQDVSVRPGRLKKGQVTSTDPLDALFTTVGGDLKETFGNTVGAGPIEFVVEPDPFTPGVKSLAELFSDLGESGSQADVRGIGSGEPGQVRAFWVKPK